MSHIIDIGHVFKIHSHSRHPRNPINEGSKERRILSYRLVISGIDADETAAFLAAAEAMGGPQAGRTADVAQSAAPQEDGRAFRHESKFS
jgi:hypothetical protein